MCTVTVIPWRGQILLASNRDELRTRPEARPPEVRQFGPYRAILPVDPAGGGTWIAVSEAGLAMTLLNVNAERQGNPTGRTLMSRGTIIPGLLSCSTLSEVVEQALTLDTAKFAPFRLIVTDRAELVEICSDGRTISLNQRRPVHAPAMFTSSGLGDALVEKPRGELFRDLCRQYPWAEAQQAFHRHQWPDRPQLSIAMNRAEARTVSHSLITLDQRKSQFTYLADGVARVLSLGVCQHRGGRR